MKWLQPLFSALQGLGRSQKSLWALSFILVITFFVAKGANLLIAYRYLPLEFSPQSSLSYGTSDSSRSAGSAANIQTILSRNIFDSEARSRTASARGPAGDGPISPCSLPIELAGTMVFQNSKFSVALIRERNSKKAGYYGIGDSIMNARIHKIERFRVILENGTRLESLELKAAESKLAAALAPEPGPIVSEPSSGGFQEIGPNRFAIPQSEVDDVLNNFSKILTQARMVPNITADNKTDGFKVFQIRPGSIYEKLNMKDNDIIKRVNGQDLDSFEKATGLFTALRNEKTITIDLVRGGTRINYTYEIR